MEANDKTQGNSNDFPVKPTGQPTGDNYSDIALTNLYSATVHQFMTEGQLIWSRFSAMLVANSIIFILAGPAIREPQRILNVLLMLSAGIFGLLISIVWLMLNNRSLKIQRYWRDCANMFSWKDYPNPTKYVYERWEWEKEKKKEKEKEKKKAVGERLILGGLGLFVIWMFIVAHLSIVVSAIWFLWKYKLVSFKL